MLIDAMKHETIELVANQIYDKLTISDTKDFGTTSDTKGGGGGRADPSVIS